MSEVSERGGGWRQTSNFSKARMDTKRKASDGRAFRRNTSSKIWRKKNLEKCSVDKCILVSSNFHKLRVASTRLSQAAPATKTSMLHVFHVHDTYAYAIAILRKWPLYRANAHTTPTNNLLLARIERIVIPVSGASYKFALVKCNYVGTRSSQKIFDVYMKKFLKERARAARTASSELYCNVP